VSPSAGPTYLSRSPEGTAALARALARHLRVGDLLGLVGPLGAGKTCFVAGLAAALGVKGRVASPSYIIARFHPGPRPLLHADAYRLTQAEDILDAGLDEWLEQAVVAVEWADRVADALPEDRVTVALVVEGEGRRIEVTARGGRGARVLEALQDEDTGHRDLEPAG